MSKLANTRIILKAAEDLGNFSGIAGEALKGLSLNEIIKIDSSVRGNLKAKLISLLGQGLSAELSDTRDSSRKSGQAPYGPHKVFRFFVPAGIGTVENQVRGLLEDREGGVLAADVKLGSTLQGINELVLFRARSYEAEEGSSLPLGASRTLQEDIEATGCALADPRVPVLFCARLKKKALDRGLNLKKEPDYWERVKSRELKAFSEGEREVLKQLKLASRGIRIDKALLCIGEEGRLEMWDFDDVQDQSVCAFGSPLQPKLKKK